MPERKKNPQANKIDVMLQNKLVNGIEHGFQKQEPGQEQEFHPSCVCFCIILVFTA